MQTKIILFHFPTVYEAETMAAALDARTRGRSSMVLGPLQDINQTTRKLTLWVASDLRISSDTRVAGVQT